MIDRFEAQRAPARSVVAEFAGRPERIARPAIRTVRPVGGGGRRGFLVLLVSGLVINVWALFPSTVESGTFVPLPQVSPPEATDAGSVADGTARRPLDSTRTIAFRLMEATTGRAFPAIRGAPYPGMVAAVATVPLRSKLQALLMLLLSRYGEDLDTTAMELKLQALLKLPDPVLEQLMEHPDLAGLKILLDGVFLATPDLAGVGSQLAKIDVVSTSGTTERIDVVRVNGRPAYIVHSTAVPPATDTPAAGSFVMPQPPTEFVVVSQLRTAADMFAFAMPTSAETIPAAPEPAMAPSVESFAPAPEFTAAMDTEYTEPPAVTSSVTAAPSTPSPAPTSTAPEPADTPSTSTDIMITGNKFEPGETLTSPTGTNTSFTSTSSAGTAEQSTPQSTSAAEPPQVTGGETNTEPSASGQTGETGSGSTGEPSP
jgi:hypothetical protein